jgi:hypothetical protein
MLAATQNWLRTNTLTLTEPYLLVLADDEGNWHVRTTTYRSKTLVVNVPGAVPKEVRHTLSMVELPPGALAGCA